LKLTIFIESVTKLAQNSNFRNSNDVSLDQKKIDREVPSAQNYPAFDSTFFYIRALTIITVEHQKFFEKSEPTFFSRYAQI